MMWLLLALLLSSSLSAEALAQCGQNEVCVYVGLAPARTALPTQTQEFTCPASGRVTSGLSSAYRDATGALRSRNGIEIQAPEGTEVRAAAAGDVLETAYDDTSHGRYVLIKHSDSPRVLTRYGYLNTARVRTGDRVARGQTIGASGRTGPATSPSVYFELTRNGVPQRDPEAICGYGGQTTSSPTPTQTPRPTQRPTTTQTPRPAVPTQHSAPTSTPRANAGGWKTAKATVFCTPAEGPGSTASGLRCPNTADNFIALPAPIGETRNKRVEVCYGGRCVTASVKDVGPWCTRDRDYVFGDADKPFAEVHRGEVLANLPGGRERGCPRNPPSNGAGIDLSAALNSALGDADGKNVRWRFVS